MSACNGKGNAGGHCCYVDGEVCQFLVMRGEVGRCGLVPFWGRLSELTDWVEAPIGKWFQENYPGYDCGDWPEKIPGLPYGEGWCCHYRGERDVV